MKFRNQISLLQFLVLAGSLLWLCTAVAGGKPPKVQGVNPNVASPGQELKAVVISGSGFNTGDVVEFFVNGDRDEDPELSQIDVVGEPAESNAEGTTLTVDILVEEGAAELFYDIVVTSRFSKYEFGVPDADDKCTLPTCVSTTLWATAPVECGTNACSFTANAQDALFALPSGLRNLLSPPTEWRRTPLKPDNCFGSIYENPPLIAELGADENERDHNIVFLQRYNDGVTPWYASVGTFARDVDDFEDRPYIFNFEGCGEGGCGAFPAGSMAGNYEGGELMRIDSHGNDKKSLSIPCRCTRSNTPNCPDDIVDAFGEPVPTPQIRITVIEVP